MKKQKSWYHLVPKNMTVMLSSETGMDVDGKWATVCNRHGTLVGSATNKQAVAAAKYPDWCDECRSEMEWRG
jgi:hypothetical protein